MDLVGGRGLPRRLHFVKFVCQNERIGSLRGGHTPGAPPLNPPMGLLVKLGRLPVCPKNNITHKATLFSVVASIPSPTALGACAQWEKSFC